MSPGKVIGKVTFSSLADNLPRGSWLMVSRSGAKELRGENLGVSTAFTPVVFDQLGAGSGDDILYVEGAEAMAPFEPHPPIDALNVALVDHITFDPPK